MCGSFAFILPIFFLTLLLSCMLFRRYMKPWLSVRLPPGSMGWPYIGETLQLYSQDPNVFFATKQKRYGEIFKTHILGCPCVMVASPEAARNVLATQAHLFKPTYPKSKEALIGPSALFFHQGDYHMRLRKLVQASLSPESVRALVPGVEAIAVSTLDSWARGRVINTFMPFGSGVHACPGNELAKIEMFVMIHHLVTKFRWEVVGSQSGIQYSPFPVPLQGLPARFWKESTS